MDPSSADPTMAGLGMGQPQDPGAPDPGALLDEIQALLSEYLQQGPDTPVAGEAQQLMDAIEQSGAASGAPDPGAPDPQGGADPLAGMGDAYGGAPPDDGGSAPQHKSFKDAARAAEPALKEMNAKKNKAAR